MTIQQIINQALGNLGSRDSRRIGLVSSSEAAVDSFNEAITEFKLDFGLSVDVISATFPTVVDQVDYTFSDLSVSDISLIKEVKYVVSGGSTEIIVPVISILELFEKVSSNAPISQGRPCFFSVYAQTKIKIWPKPSEVGTFYVLVDTWQGPYTTGSLSLEQPLGRPWDNALVSYVTMSLFDKLQQFDEGAVWRLRLRSHKSQAKKFLNRSQALTKGARSVGDDLLPHSVLYDNTVTSPGDYHPDYWFQ